MSWAPDVRFGVLRELMLALDVVPVSGQEDVRRKMLLILRGESLRLESPIAAADLVSLVECDDRARARGWPICSHPWPVQPTRRNRHPRAEPNDLSSRRFRRGHGWPRDDWFPTTRPSVPVRPTYRQRETP